MYHSKLPINSDVNFTFNPLDYDNYEYDQDGNLDMTKVPQNQNRNQNQFQNGEKGQNRIDRKILNNAGTKSDKSEPQKSGGGDEVEEEYPFIELNRLFTNNSEKFEEKSSGAEDSEYIYEYIDVEDLGPIL